MSLYSHSLEVHFIWRMGTRVSGRYHTNWRAPNSIFDANVSEWWTDWCCSIVHENHSLMVEWTLEAVSSVLTMNDEMNIAKRTESAFPSPSQFSYFHEIDILFCVIRSMHLNLLSGRNKIFRKSRKSNKLLNYEKILIITKDLLLKPFNSTLSSIVSCSRVSPKIFIPSFTSAHPQSIVHSLLRNIIDGQNLKFYFFFFFASPNCHKQQPFMLLFTFGYIVRAFRMIREIYGIQWSIVCI